jgi:hypothetical protein
VEIFSKSKKSIDICTYGKGVYLTINTKPIWEGYVKVKQRGAKLRWITDMTKENLSDCKELMRIAEVRHLDQIIGLALSRNPQHSQNNSVVTSSTRIHRPYNRNLSYALSPIINHIGVFCIVTCLVRFMHSNPL